MKEAVASPCPVCASAAANVVRLDFPLFRHLDYATVDPGPGFLGRCPDCNLVWRLADAESLAAIDALYRSPEYVEGRRPDHTVFLGTDAEPVSQYRLQAELLAGQLPGIAAPAILDVGCFDGALLRAFAERYPEADLCGFDVGEDRRAIFPKGGRFRFVAGDLRRIDGRFDLIVLSHALQYVGDLAGLAGQWRRLLKPDGRIFVQVPDFARKPSSLLYGDARYHFTADTLANVLGRFGLRFSPLDRRWFPRDVLGLAEFGEPAVAPAESCSLLAGVADLERTALALRRLAGTSRLAVLGTTSEAAFADNVLGPAVGFLVDENPNQEGGSFHGKSVFHPRMLTADDTVVVPYGATAEAIRRRLAARYRGRFVAV